MHVVLDGMAGGLVRCLEQRSDIHVKADIGKCRGDYLGAAVVSVLPQLDDQQARAPAFLLCEGGYIVLDAGKFLVAGIG